MSCSLPSIFLISSLGPTNFASHLATRRAVARPFASRTMPIGTRPPRMWMPSARCLLDLVLVGLHLVDIEYRGQRHFCALLGGNVGDVLRHASGDGLFDISWLGVRNMTQTTRNGCYVNGCVTTTNNYHTFTNMLQTSVVEGFQECCRCHHVRGCAVSNGQGTTRLLTWKQSPMLLTLTG